MSISLLKFCCKLWLENLIDTSWFFRKKSFFFVVIFTIKTQVCAFLICIKKRVEKLLKHFHLQILFVSDIESSFLKHYFNLILCLCLCSILVFLFSLGLSLKSLDYSWKFTRSFFFVTKYISIIHKNIIFLFLNASQHR